MKTYGERLLEVYTSEAKRLGRKLTSAEIVSYADRLHDEIHKNKKGPEIPITKMTEAEFVAWLEAEPALAGVDVKKEIGKCEFWCKANGKGLPSRRRIVNWVNGAERPMVGNYAGASSASRAAADKRKDPPHGWSEFMKEKILDWERENPNGGDAPGKSALALYNDFYRMPTSWQAAAWKELP